MTKSLLAVRALTILAMVLIGAAYVSPIWWVSLKAPQYPEHTFPDGIRIHFHMNGVFNGCTARDNNADVYEDENDFLDCVHEMDVINHYIGMEPIAKGAVYETIAAPYLVGFTEILLLASLFYRRKGWWLLYVPGIIIPVAFVVDYSAWLWWFGHNLHPWGAFTVKPFMPTVFGEGKVAQFSTFSYPHYGFLLLLGATLVLLLAFLLKRKALRSI